MLWHKSSDRFCSFHFQIRPIILKSYIFCPKDYGNNVNCMQHLFNFKPQFKPQSYINDANYNYYLSNTIINSFRYNKFVCMLYCTYVYSPKTVAHFTDNLWNRIINKVWKIVHNTDLSFCACFLLYFITSHQEFLRDYSNMHITLLI